MEQAASRRRRRLRPAYRISDLPDNVLHSILRRLGSAPAAARTSVLSSRWRHVWAYLPQLVFQDSGYQFRNPSFFLNSVDGALDRYAATTLRSLYIFMFNVASRVPAARVSRWLRFSSERVAGDLLLCLPWRPADGEEEELELPVCASTRTIQLGVGHGFRQLRLPRIGAFGALTLMIIRDARIDANDLERVVCWQCPCLVELHLMAMSLVAVADVTVRSASLRRLHFEVENTSRLVLDTPSIEELSLSKVFKVSVVAPKFAEMIAQRHGAAADLHRQLLGRRLRWLVVKGCHQVMPVLMRHFDAVDRLELDLTVSSGEGYKTFLRATNKLTKCDVLVVNMTTEWHAYEPSLLYLVRKSAAIRKLVVHLPWTECSPCMPGCTCGRKGSEKTDNIKLDSLEEVEINDFTGEYHHVKIVKLLHSCKDISASRIVVNISPLLCSLSEGTCQRIRNEAHPSTNIRFNVWLHGRWEPYS
ncbi:unnamed protein product [Urochloa decumbens]|uniref:F-box domain-containing protein n=1 Tax=Urochloa decumbens TaxID=240449 RepID=A0ABC8VKT2_9POAL